MRNVPVVLCLVAALTVPLPCLAQVHGAAQFDDLFGEAVAAGDFDGDGDADLVVGIPGERTSRDTDNQLGLGAVILFDSTPLDGVGSVGNELWSQDGVSPAFVDDIEETAEEADRFGSSLTVGDFNGDGAVDLAIGVSGEDLLDDEFVGGGVVHVVYGDLVDGLVTTGNQLWHPDSPDVQEEWHQGDRFGASMAAGDFNGDGFDDLAIGAPREEQLREPYTCDIDTDCDTGAVRVLYGTTLGLTAVDNQLWWQDTDGVVGDAARNDEFGTSLAAGDFNGDGFDDLAIGVPFDDEIGIVGAGGVNVLYGSAKDGGGGGTIGLSTLLSQYWLQDTASTLDPSEPDDYWGTSLAAGDFNGDGFDDLAIGTPDEDLEDGDPVTFDPEGMVNVLYGGTSPDALLSSVDSQSWTQSTAGVLNVSEIDDLFAWTLATGDFNGDGFDDLAIGVPGEDVLLAIEDEVETEIQTAGAVNVLYGSASTGGGGGSIGLTDVGDQYWTQDTTGVQLASEEDDYFGRSLAVGDFDADGFDDLVVGVPFEDVGRIVNAGASHVLYGSDKPNREGDPIGLTAADDQAWHQNSK
jgi:hypothetical protein